LFSLPVDGRERIASIRPQRIAADHITQAMRTLTNEIELQ